jgi:hypothetical protein
MPTPFVAETTFFLAKEREICSLGVCHLVATGFWLCSAALTANGPWGLWKLCNLLDAHAEQVHYPITVGFLGFYCCNKMSKTRDYIFYAIFGIILKSNYLEK